MPINDHAFNIEMIKPGKTHKLYTTKWQARPHLKEPLSTEWCLIGAPTPPILWRKWQRGYIYTHIPHVHCMEYLPTFAQTIHHPAKCRYSSTSTMGCIWLWKTLPGDWIAHFTALLLRLQQATSTVHGRPRNRGAGFERVKTPGVFCVSLGKPKKNPWSFRVWSFFSKWVGVSYCS